MYMCNINYFENSVIDHLSITVNKVPEPIEIGYFKSSNSIVQLF